MQPDTLIVRAGRDPGKFGGLVNPPVCRASTVVFGKVADFQSAKRDEQGKLVYGRYGTPTAFCLADAIAELEGGYRSALFPSGLAAISASLLAFVETGDHVLMVDSVYRPTRNFCEGMLKRMGVTTTYYNPTAGAAIADLMRPRTRVVFVESPGSLSFEVQDIPAIAEAAHRHGARVLMDNTWASPLFFKPFEYGVDVSIQAGTKYIVGHSDAMLGAATATRDAWPQLFLASAELGQCIGPDDAYLGQRGLRTLSVRLRQHQASALKVAEWLRGRPEVERVLYPALPDDPGHALWRRDFLGASGLFGIVLRAVPAEAVAAFIENLSLFGLGASWGGYESLVQPGTLARNHAPDFPVSLPLLRIHVGLEDPDDLIADLKTGFASMQRSAAA